MDKKITLTGNELFRLGNKLTDFEQYLIDNEGDTRLIYACGRNIDKLQSRIKTAMKQMQKAPAGMKDFNRKRKALVEEKLGRPVNENDRIGADAFREKAMQNLGIDPADFEGDERHEAGDKVDAEAKRLYIEFKEAIDAFEDDNKELIDEVNRIDKENNEKLSDIEETVEPHFMMLSRFPEKADRTLANYITTLSPFIYDDTYDADRRQGVRSVPLPSRNGATDVPNQTEK